MAGELGLVGQHSGPLAAYWFEPEHVLSDWLADNTLVAYSQCEDPQEHEAALLTVHPSPLNISLRKTSPFARQLIAVRAAYRERCSS